MTTISSSAGTTTVGIKVRETISSDLSVGGSVNTDWNDLAGTTQSVGIPTANGGGFGNSQSFMDLTSKKFGTLRVGTPNTFTLTNATSIASPLFSTGIGSAYSSTFSIANGLTTGTSGIGGTVAAQAAITTTANAGGRAIRQANTIQYSSPVFAGFSAHLGMNPENNNLTADAGRGNTVGTSEYALRYTNGPVDAMYSSIKYTVGSNGVSQTTLSAAGAATITSLTAQTSTQNLLGVAYQVMPGLKLNAGFGDFSSSANNFKGTSQSFGGTYTMGMIDILAQMAKVDDTSSTNIDRKLTGLGVNYNFSKTTRAYVRYDNVNFASNVGAVSGSAQKRTAIGISRSF